jgi:hypothetical protein
MAIGTLLAFVTSCSANLPSFSPNYFQKLFPTFPAFSTQITPVLLAPTTQFKIIF